MSHISTANLGWIALGVAALLIIALIGGLVLVVRAVSRRRAGGGLPGSLRGVAANVAGAGPTPSPTEIMAALDALPPLEKPRAAKMYRGMPVRWEVTFEAIDVTGLFTLRLMCTERGTSYPWLWCYVRKGRYPQLHGLLKHAPLRVSGSIASVQINDIYLRNVQLEFDSP